jgi:hypothetical protein
MTRSHPDVSEQDWPVERDGRIVSHDQVILEDSENLHQVVYSCQEEVPLDDDDQAMWEFLNY